METVGAERDGVTRKKAEAELRERLVRVERQHYRRPQGAHVLEWSATWLEEGKRRRGWKPKTAKHARASARAPGRPLRQDPSRLDPSARRGRDTSSRRLGERSARSVIAEVNLLHDVLGRAVAEELIQSNPATGVERPRATPMRWRILEPDEVRRSRRRSRTNGPGAVFLTLHLTGLRRHELQALRWRDVSLTEGTLRVVESKRRRASVCSRSRPALVDVLDPPLPGDAVQGGHGLRVRASRDAVHGSAPTATAACSRRRSQRPTYRTASVIRPFHDARHAALTHLALTPARPSSCSWRPPGTARSPQRGGICTLRGVRSREAAAALEDRLLAGRKFYPSEPISADLSRTRDGCKSRPEQPGDQAREM